jgi:hypothetical protein
MLGCGVVVLVLVIMGSLDLIALSILAHIDCLVGVLGDVLVDFLSSFSLDIVVRSEYPSQVHNVTVSFAS